MAELKIEKRCMADLKSLDINGLWNKTRGCGYDANCKGIMLKHRPDLNLITLFAQKWK